MNLTVYTSKRYIYILSPNRPTVIRHKIPKRNRYFKEELRGYIEDIRGWLCGQLVEEIDMYFPNSMSWYHQALYQAILRATKRPDKLVLVRAYISEEVLAVGSAD